MQQWKEKQRTSGCDLSTDSDWMKANIKTNFNRLLDSRALSIVQILSNKKELLHTDLGFENYSAMIFLESSGWVEYHEYFDEKDGFIGYFVFTETGKELYEKRYKNEVLL